MVDLLPCPFCGNPVSLVSFHGSDRGIGEIEVECTSCLYRLELMTDAFAPFESDAVEVWNRRASDVTF